MESEYNIDEMRIKDAFWNAVDALNQLQAIIAQEPVSDYMSGRSKACVLSCIKNKVDEKGNTVTSKGKN